MFCEKCGQIIRDNAKFCPYCGEEVREIEIVTDNKQLSYEWKNVNVDNVQSVGLSRRERWIGILISIVLGVVILPVVTVCYLVMKEKSISTPKTLATFIGIILYNMIRPFFPYKYW